MDRKIFSDTFTRLKLRLRSMAAGILHDEEDAEDALQDAFCRMWARRDFRENIVNDGMAVIAVRNMCVDYLRRRAIGRPSLLEDCDPSEIRDIDQCAAEKTLWEDGELEDLTNYLMSKLNHMQRSVFEMVSNGMDYDIVALRLDIPEATARQHMCRARKILKSEYKKWQGNG